MRTRPRLEAGPTFPGARLLLLVPLLAAFPPLSAQDTPADLLQRPGVNLADRVSRQQVVDGIRRITERRRETARARARALGLPLRVRRPNGALQEIVAFDGDKPLYFTTHNANAAISTGANVARATHSLDGSGITIGIWDGGSAHATHQEFGGRVVVKDGSASDDHATHVGGTLAASGVLSSARGMAPAATIDSYDWNSDVAEMTARGASAPNQTGKLYLSNHSYGFTNGWNEVGTSGRMWEWWGDGATAAGTEHAFGRYNTYARDQDALAHSAPYYLIFRSAGNERNDNPSPGDSVGLSPGGSATVSYDPALHPGGDGQYRGGYDTIAFAALAKNVITVGAVNDAVTSGQRDPAKALLTSFSSWGPTDDGRIKPDVVANGASLYSPLNGSNSSYGNFSGTSMAAPNAAGSAALLIQQYGNLFPSQAMRASTLKGLLIHTADDRGNAGPDYQYGWGLVNVKAAADLIADHAARPERQRVTESSVSTSLTSHTYPFTWDGSSPIRATLCWTDPAGVATSTSDHRSPRLVNNLQLKVIAPGGAEYLPYVMPFVGNWTQGAMSSAATPGVNNTDNVEQVWLPSPPAAGTYQLVVSYSGTLTNGQQAFSLLLDGAAAAPPPPLPLQIASISPASAYLGPATIELTGDAFRADTAVKLTRAGQADIVATSVQLTDNKLLCQFDLAGAAAGIWSVVVTNPDSETFTLGSAFTVIGAHWGENFDGTPTGWTSQATTGSNSWSIVSSSSQSPPKSYFAVAPGIKTTTNLISPVVEVPSNAANLQLRFWHSYVMQSGQDGGRLELSVDGGSTWFGVDSQDSGASFASNGYPFTISNSGSGANRSEFEGLMAWTGNGGGYKETVVNLTDTAKFAGSDLRMRWRLATNGSTPSAGWWIDSITLISNGELNQPPVITTAPTSGSGESVTDPDSTVHEIARGASANLGVTAGDDGGEAALTYTWSLTSGPAPVFFSSNGDNAAKNTTVEFQTSGDHWITVTVRDAPGKVVSEGVRVRVLQTASGTRVTPVTVSLAYGATQQFAASLLDQFGSPMSTQPGSFAWGASGGGTIDGNGLFSATSAGGPHAVTAGSGGFTDMASVTVTPAVAAVELGNLSQTYTGAARPVSVTTTPAMLAHSITYNGSSTPPVDAGTYAVEVSVTDPNHHGSASGTLVVSKAIATVDLAGLAATFDGAPKVVTASTTPAGLGVGITYDGSPDAPSAIGTYDIVATVDDANHSGSATGQLVISGQTYEQWQALEFSEAQILSGAADPGADADRDGLDNFAEHALGTDPNAYTAQPGHELDPDYLTITFTRPIGLADVIYHAESGAAPGPWSAETLEVIDSDATTETVRVRAARPVAPEPLFLRLRFEQAGP